MPSIAANSSSIEPIFSHFRNLDIDEVEATSEADILRFAELKWVLNIISLGRARP